MRKPVMVAYSLVLLSLAGCRAEQTQQAKAPEVDVDVAPGQLPRYKLLWADVDIGTTERSITVPVVRLDTAVREITVPYIDINPPGSGDRDERTVMIEVDVPHPDYQLQITEVLAAGDDLWVVAHLSESSDTQTPQVATRVSDQIVVNAPDDLYVRKVVVGDRPTGVFNQQFRFIESRGVLNRQMPRGARVLYRRSSEQQTS